jgi:hypothetical protein
VRPRLLVLSLAAALVAGCGSSSGDTKPSPAPEPGAKSPPGLREAERATVADFPAVGGRTLQQVSATVRNQAELGLATSVLLPGHSRVAFGMIGPDNRFLYGKSALYVASAPGARARGPYPAPADPMTVRPPFVSRNAAADSADIKAIYETDVRFPRPGHYALLAVTRTAHGLAGSGTRVTVLRRSPIPNVGEQPPAIHTDTVTSAGGDLSKIDTRDPHDDMHRVDLHDAIGRRPVALLFSTPLLCQSRVCGPVTDIALQLESEFGDRMTFIHQEVYVANDVNRGLRPQLLAFHLDTEPWLFTFTRDGRIASRLEGAFGVRAFRAAVEAALRR